MSGAIKDGRETGTKQRIVFKGEDAHVHDRLACYPFAFSCHLQPSANRQVQCRPRTDAARSIDCVSAPKSFCCSTVHLKCARLASLWPTFVCLVCAPPCLAGGIDHIVNYDNSGIWK